MTRSEVAALPPHMRTAPFRTFGCVLHRMHKPMPSMAELHHRFPLYLQARVWPDVNPNKPDSAHDSERIPVCADGHNDIHHAINAALAGGPQKHIDGIGLAERKEAAESLRRFKDQGGFVPTDHIEKALDVDGD